MDGSNGWTWFYVNYRMDLHGNIHTLMIRMPLLILGTDRIELEVRHLENSHYEYRQGLSIYVRGPVVYNFTEDPERNMYTEYGTVTVSHHGAA